MIIETYQETTFIYPSEDIKNYWSDFDKQQCINKLR